MKMNSNFSFDRKKIKDNPNNILDYLGKFSTKLENLETRISELGQKNHEHEVRISELER